ncbi:DUF5056 domain-containing protein [Dyella sp.]|uniref:DUF5056 domain-containing protein n=1 Tax=Dyella sp. TaxID=1869338 RepID=UPI002ED1DB3B
MHSPDDNDIDALLRQSFEGPVADDGFTDRVMQRLPARRHRLSWPMLAGVAAGIATCWLSLSSAPLYRAGWTDWLSGHWSSPAIIVWLALSGMSLLALGWVLAEPENR